MLPIIPALILLLLTQDAECQFAYPVDPNPPQNPLTFQCYTCKSDVDSNCMTVTNVTNTETCTGIRIGCWIIVDMESMLYERTCTQPPTIRQGVFCNRLMEGREFCYYVNEPTRGRVRKCSKCCLNDRCNGENLRGEHDPTFQTCVSCDGSTEPDCNSLSSSDIAPHLTEQCLMPNSDCWTQKAITDAGEIYTRGCQITPCDDSNVQETCTTNGDTTTCSQCCPDANRCNREMLRGAGARLLPNVFQIILLQSFVLIIL